MIRFPVRLTWFLGVSGMCCLALAADGWAAGTKTDSSGSVVITDDLESGTAGSVGLKAGTLQEAGSIGQAGTLQASGGAAALEPGYFSMEVSSPTAPNQNVYFSSITFASIALAWSNGVPTNPVGTMYEVDASTDPTFGLLDTIVILTQGFSATFTALTTNATYYVRLRASYLQGDESVWVALPSTLTPQENIPPTITDLQAGDNTWRRSPTATYNVQFNDQGGSHLSYFQVQVSTNPNGVPILIPYTQVVAPGSLFPNDSYTTPWSLPASVFAGLMQGVTNYITVQVFDGAGNSTTTANAFYVKVDTIPPQIVDNVSLSAQTVWRNKDPGGIYNFVFSDNASGLDTIQYSASLNAGTGDAGIIAWTTLASGLSTLNYSTNVAINFAGLADASTNYISVRTWDVAGSTQLLVDAFRVLKDTTGPVVAITAPINNAFYSALSTFTGTALSVVGLVGSEVSVQSTSTLSFWDGATNGFNSVVPVWTPAPGGTSWSSGSVVIPWVNGNKYNVIARSSDVAGNYSSPYSTSTFIFDNVPPIVMVASPATNSTVQSLPSISGTAADPNLGPGPGPASGVATVQVGLQRLSDGLWWNFFTQAWGSAQVSTAAVGTASWSTVPSALLQANLASNASYFISAAANDNAVPPNKDAFALFGATFTFLDITPPAAVANLSATPGVNPGELIAQWSAPGDDGNSGIILVGKFAIQYSTFAGANFSTTTAQVIISTGLVNPGTLETRRLTSSDGLSPGTTYYLAVWTQDDDGNWSAVSNVAAGQTAATPPNSIMGHVVNLSTQGITGVLINAYNISGSQVSTTFTLNDGSGTYLLGGLSSGTYRILAAWTVNGLTSSVSKDGIPMGAFNVDFVLNLTYTLGSITGQMLSLGGSSAATSASAYRAQSAAKAVNAYVELFQNGRRIVVSDVKQDGRFMIQNLLPGKYSVRGFNGISMTPLVDVDLLEGEVHQVNFVWDPLPEQSVYAFPNPARNRTTFRFETSLLPLEAQIMVFDIAGNFVKEIAGDVMTSPQLGLYHADWDLTNARGEAVVSGVYLFEVKVKSGESGQTAKIVKKLAVIR